MPGFNLVSSRTKFNYTSDMPGVARRCRDLNVQVIPIMEWKSRIPRGFQTVGLPTCLLFEHLVSLRILCPDLFHLQTFSMSSFRLAEKSAGSKSCRFIFRCKTEDFSHVFVSTKNDHVRETLRIIAWIDKTAAINFYVPKLGRPCWRRT